MKGRIIVFAFCVSLFSQLFIQAGAFSDEIIGSQSVATGVNGFAVDLYSKLNKQDGNIFFSPSSISTALAMVYAGARGNTEKQMAEVLHFALTKDKLHQGYSGLIKDLEASPGPGTNGYQLSIANALWAQKGYANICLQYQQLLHITLGHIVTLSPIFSSSP